MIRTTPSRAFAALQQSLKVAAERMQAHEGACPRCQMALDGYGGDLCEDGQELFDDCKGDLQRMVSEVSMLKDELSKTGEIIKSAQYATGKR